MFDLFSYSVVLFFRSFAFLRVARKKRNNARVDVSEAHVW